MRNREMDSRGDVNIEYALIWENDEKMNKIHFLRFHKKKKCLAKASEHAKKDILSLKKCYINK